MSHEWMGIYFDESPSHIWGFLEQHTGDSDHGLTVIFSSNWGRTWKELSYLKKPHYSADYQRFHIGSNGKGYAVFALAAEYKNSEDLFSADRL